MTPPTARTHLEQARENRSHAEWLVVARLGDPTAMQWAATAAFYSALHALSDYFARSGVVVVNHTLRARALADPINGVPVAVHDTYRLLERRSRRARYLLAVFSEQDVRNLIDRELAAVAAFTGL